jgi:pimeloyl-ACP methyl ester carboxylesterase
VPGADAAAPTATVEEAGYVPSGDGFVYVFAARPASPAAAGAVILGPIAEEKRSSARALVDLARELASAGILAVRADWRGTGDSSGRSRDLALRSMVEDAASAAREVRSAAGVERLALVGLRLGALVSCLALDEVRPDALVLVEPVVSGSDCVRDLMRAHAIRRMMTRGASTSPEGGGTVDLDGLELSRRFLDELSAAEAADAGGDPAKTRPSALVIQVGPRRSPSAALAAVARRLSPGARCEAVVAEPFWLQAENVDAGGAIRLTRAFLSETLLARPGTGGEAPRARGD